MELLTKGQLGLAGMRERARELGAELTIESKPGAGSRVVLRGHVERMKRAVVPASTSSMPSNV
jgi:nitrate/nitrite-specific signal transduction histidine kinase